MLTLRFTVHVKLLIYLSVVQTDFIHEVVELLLKPVIKSNLTV